MTEAVQPKQSLAGLKALVGILGVLIILGTALVIGVVIQRIYAHPPAPSMPAATSAAAALGTGESIKAISNAGADVAVWVSGPKGDRLLMIDPASGQARVVLGPAP